MRANGVQPGTFEAVMDRFSAERQRRARRWLIALFVASAIVAQGPARASDGATSVASDEVLVRGHGLDALHAIAGARVLRTIPVLQTQVVRVPDAERALAIYRAHPSVTLAERNVRGAIALSPSDACHDQPCSGIGGQWHHLMTNTPFGWDAMPVRSPVTIAVLDTKIDASHPDWVNAGGASQLVAGHDFVPADRQNGSARYHGTFVAGLAAAATGNDIDAAGVGYAARILPLTVVDGGGMTDAATLAEAIIHGWRAGARVINLSLGLLEPSQTVHDAIRVVARDALVVAAAGNNTGDRPFYPGSYPEVMSVSGTDVRDRRASCSNYNAKVSVSAPADRLIGLQHMPGRLVQAPCGTSAAAPQVAGLAALLFMQDPTRTPEQIRAIIERTADDLGPAGRDDEFGHGRINIARALSAGPAAGARVIAAGPSATAARATVVSARGGTTTISARVPSGTERAQVFIGSPSAPPVALRISATTATAAVAVSLPAGAHAIWVRAADARGWGPTTVGVLGVDGSGPSIWAASGREAIRATGQPLRISFAIGDDYSTAFTHAVEVRSSATNALVWRAVRPATPGGAQVYEWLPGLDVPAGHYRVLIGAADEVGNVAMKEIGAVLA